MRACAWRAQRHVQWKNQNDEVSEQPPLLSQFAFASFTGISFFKIRVILRMFCNRFCQNRVFFFYLPAEYVLCESVINS